MSRRLVVIGADAAGMSAASQARRLAGDDLEVIAFERGEHTSYSACGIPYFVGGLISDADRLVVRTAEAHRARGIDVRLGREVVSIDLDARRVRVRSADGEQDEAFDALMVGTGARPIRPPLENVDADGIFGVQTLADGIAVRRDVDEREPRAAVVVGAGYIGLEMAEAFLARGIPTTVVDVASQPMSTLDPDMGTLVADAMRAKGIELRLGERVTGFETDDGRVAGVVTDTTTVPADIVILGLGVRPNSELAADAGIEVGETGGIVTDERMRTSAEGIWAAGDCVETYHRVARAPVAIALGTHANKQGRVAGTNIAGGEARFEGVLGTAITRVCDLEVGRTGLGVEDARAAGYEPASEVVRSKTRAGYFPGASAITVKVIADRTSGRLLGAQIVGLEEAGKRIDVFATALWNEMTVGDIAGMDLSYSPPFSPVWDPVLIASRILAESLLSDGSFR